MATVERRVSDAGLRAGDAENLAPGWAVETMAIWAQFPERKGILDLSNRAISHLPPELFRMRKLTKLTVANSKLTTVVGEWHMLAEVELLESIVITQNLLTSLDDSLLCLKSLKELLLNENQIESLPSDIGRLVNLERLELSHNRVSSLPPSFGSLLFLKVLDLSHNQLTQVPPALFSLALLRLDLSHNQLVSIPNDISQMRKLVVLRINDNHLTALPTELGLCSSLEEFSGHNNPYTDMPELAGLETKDHFFRVLRNHLRQNDDSRALLFNEKDTRNNVRFEINEEISDKPILTACTPEKLIVFLTQVNPPDPPTFKSFQLCYSYILDPGEVIDLMYLRFKMNHFKQAVSEDMLKVSKLVQLRVFSGTIKFINQFNQDGVAFSEKTLHKLKLFIDLLSEAGQAAPARQLHTTLETNERNKGKISSTFDDEVAKTTAISTKEQKKLEKDKKKQEKEKKRQEEKDKKQQAKLAKEAAKKRKKDGGGDTPCTPGSHDLTPSSSQHNLAEVASFPPPVFIADMSSSTTSSSGSLTPTVSPMMGSLPINLPPPLVGAVPLHLPSPLAVAATVNAPPPLAPLPPPPALAPLPPIAERVDIMAIPPKDIACQLALLDANFISKIEQSELLHQRWAKNGKEENAPHLLASINHFNKVSAWISTEILLQKDLKRRTQLLGHVLSIAQELLLLGDFSSTYSLASALGSSPVSRLKQTWQLLDSPKTAIQQSLNRLSDNSGNYRNYRSLLSQKAGSPIIPYMGLILSDLTFAEEGNSNFIGDSDLINFSKFRIIHRIIDDFTNHQSFCSHFKQTIAPDEAIQRIILNSDRIEEDDLLYNESLLCEASRRQTTISNDLHRSLLTPSHSSSALVSSTRSRSHSSSFEAGEQLDESSLPSSMSMMNIGGANV